MLSEVRPARHHPDEVNAQPADRFGARRFRRGDSGPSGPAAFIRALGRDPALPRGVRIRLWLLLAYLAVPLDLVPDFTPVLGYGDDAIVVAATMRSFVRHAGPQALDRHWSGTDDDLATVRAGLPAPPATRWGSSSSGKWHRPSYRRAPRPPRLIQVTTPLSG
ncbi:YkvA family protein [Streptomyces sp. SLBN-118]|uniref:YkvA family protein n=1 Tax=Streptomyces sp. SLBN-118 TaxID=2768454 RepID=UPI001C92F8A5|nr:DUF1232 domain-containing protein [Streptomyces sp. SLBN-118]